MLLIASGLNANLSYVVFENGLLQETCPMTYLKLLYRMRVSAMYCVILNWYPKQVDKRIRKYVTRVFKFYIIPVAAEVPA